MERIDIESLLNEAATLLAYESEMNRRALEDMEDEFETIQ